MNFQKNVLQQRERMRLTEEEIAKRIRNSPFGEKTKALARRWAECESLGGVGWGLYDAMPLIVRAKGSYLYDADGKSYLDFLSGLSVSALGQCNEEITKIIQEQAGKLTHHFDFPHEQRLRLSEKLIKLSRLRGKARVVYGVSGSEGIELAVRAARYYTGQPYILTAYGDYHGNTYGTMGLTGKGGMQPYFYPVPPVKMTGHFHFPYCYRCFFDKEYPACSMYCMKSLERLLDSKESPFTDGTGGINNVAAILVEPFQSSAGYYVPPTEYLQELRRIADKFGMLLIIDEIQAGLGRTGKLWAFEHSDIEPDMFVSSKALGGGIPISAVVAKGEILAEWGPVAHVSTMAGNVLACAAGNYVLDVISSKDFLKQVNETGAYLMEGLRDLEKRHSIIGNINNKGIFTGIELVNDRKTKEPAVQATTEFRDRALAEGVVFEKGGYYQNRIQLIPSLNVGRSEIDKLVAIFDRTFAEVEKKAGIKK
jgi:4-aminobutyrate aminotransferase